MVRSSCFISLKLLIIISSIAICLHVNAQKQPSFEKLDLKSGLPSNTIYNIKFGKNNLLYLAHGKGLSSFDGGYFRNYFNAYQANTELSNIMEASDGSIFCKAFNNTIYKLINDSLLFAFWTPNKIGFSKSTIIGDDIIAFGNDSVILFNFKTQKKTILPYPKLTTQWPSATIVMGDWYSTESLELGLILIDDKKNVYNYLCPVNNQTPHLHFSYGQAFGTQTKKLNELYWLNKNKKIKNANHIDALINYINVLEEKIYVSTTKGLVVLDDELEIKEYYPLDLTSVSAIAKSKDGNSFISTIDNGLYKVANFNSQEIIKFKSTCNQFAIQPDKTLLIESKLKDYNAENSEKQKVKYSTNTNAIFFTQAVQQAKNMGYSFSNTPIDAIDHLPNIKDFTIMPNAILFGTQGGLYLYTEPNTKHWINELIMPDDIKNLPFKKLSIYQEYVPSVKYNEVKDVIMVNTYNGLFEVSEINITGKQIPDPINTAVKDIEYWQGYLLLASTMHGVVIWDGTKYIYNSNLYPTKGYLKHFYKTKNELWVHSEEAIYSFSKNGNRIYNSNNGVPVDNVKNIFVADSTLFLNKGTSIVSVPKYFQKSTSTVPEIIVHSVKQGHQILNQNSALSYKQNDISILFSYINYSGSNNHIAYRINNQRLIHLNNSTREINIPNLQPDNYKIALYSVVNDVVSAKPMHVVQFRIAPPFYKSILFTLLLIALSLGIAFLIARYILNNYKRIALHKEAQFLMEKELDKSMLSSIKAQMNPHFIFNALNTIQSYIYSNEKQNASLYISKFSDLTRSILDMSNKETVTLSEEIKSLTLYLELEKMRFEDAFNYDIQVDKNILLEQIKIPSMLVQPYIENAIKHGLLHKKNNRQLVLSYQLHNNILTIIIDDNGIGRKRSEELNAIKNRHHTSFAMDANRKRLEILKSTHDDIEFEIIDKIGELGEGLGTKVLIKLKVF